MYPASEILKHKALRSNSGPLDPLHVAKEIGVSAADTLAWRVVAQMAVPPVMSEDERIQVKPAGLLSIMVVGDPCRGILLCFDRGPDRECVRMYPDGVRFAIIDGLRKDPVLEYEISPAAAVELAAEPEGNSKVVDHMLDLVERVGSNPATDEVN